MSKTAFNPVRGNPPAINWHSPDELMIDPSYQRSVQSTRSQQQIERIARDWDWRLCAPLMVARRADGLYVIDGQHRTLAARMRGDIAHLPCCVADFESVAEEARLFVLANRQRQPSKKIDQHRAAVVAGDRRATEMEDIVRSAGLTLAGMAEVRSGMKGALYTLRSIEVALHKHGRAVTSAALVALAGIGRDQVMSQPAVLFRGLILLFANPPQGFDPDRLEEILPRYSVDEWTDHPDLPIENGKRGSKEYYKMRAILIAEMADHSWDGAA